MEVVMVRVINQYGIELFFEAVVELMDDDVREAVHASLEDGTTIQKFFDLYCDAHEEKFGGEFFLNASENPSW
jgi:hypothetical protein